MSRTRNTIKNARVNILFYVILFFLALFSRKIFITLLGNDVVGLNATIQNILGLLNLAELGVWPATAYALYKYIHDENREKIKEIITLFGYFYKIIGYFILGASLIMAFFLPLMFKNSGIDFYFVVAAFFTCLYSILLTYFFNFKQILFVADQKNYVIVFISNTIQIVKVLLQIGALYIANGNFYIWLLLEVVFATINTIYLNVYVVKYYPWLKLDKFSKNLLQEHKDILKNIKRMVSHKFAAVVVQSTDNILVYSFTGLVQVTYFTNYTLIVDKAVGFFNTMLNSGLASIGNLVASKDEKRITSVFWELLAMRYWMAGIVVICIYYLIDPFILLWLGPKYILDNVIVMVLIFNTYIVITRWSVDNFFDAYGLYGHVWAPWTEAGLNLILSLVLGRKYGIVGILTGTAISAILIVCIWKPFYLFRSGFKNNKHFDYWMNILKYLLLLGIVWSVVHFITKTFYNEPPKNYLYWGLRALVIAFVAATLNGTMIYFTSSGMRLFIRRIYSLAKNKIV